MKWLIKELREMKNNRVYRLKHKCYEDKWDDCAKEIVDLKRAIIILTTKIDFGRYLK